MRIRGVHDGPTERLEREVEADHGGGDVAVDAEAVLADGVHHEVVAVHLVALGRRGSHEAVSATVIAHVEGRSGQGVVGRAGASGQLGHVSGDVDGSPVPEAGDDGGVGVERVTTKDWCARAHHSTTGAATCRRRHDVGVGQRLAVSQVLAGDLKDGTAGSSGYGSGVTGRSRLMLARPARWPRSYDWATRPTLGSLDYVHLRDVSLRQKLEAEHGVYLAEGEKVVRRAVEAGHRPGLVPDGASMAGRVWPTCWPPPTLPCFVLSEQAIETLTGFHVHRGALAALERPAPTRSAESWLALVASW